MMPKFFNQKRRNERNGQSAAVIRYDSETDRAPVVVAQGRGAVADQIIAMAKQHDIPLQQDSSLIGTLIDMDLGDNIPPQMYSVIAEILLMLEEMENEKY